MLLNGSLAVTVKLNATLEVTFAGATTLKWLAAAGVTVIDLVPVMVALTVSVAVSVWRPAVLRVALKVWTPASAAVKV